MRPDPSRLARIAGVVIPIRAFTLGNLRLADALDDGERSELARGMADRVLAAATPLRVVVVSSAPEVRGWAEENLAVVLSDPGDLNRAAQDGITWCREHGFSRAIVAHADLPRATPSALLRLAVDAAQPIVGLVPCHRDDGTPVLSVPTHSDFAPSYGPGSFRRHLRTAHDAGLAVRVVRDAELGFDVDVPADLLEIGLSAAPARR
jgi:2-phospho-L-lactate guanylyltransferase